MVLRDGSASPGEVETGRYLGLSVWWLSGIHKHQVPVMVPVSENAVENGLNDT